MRQLRFLAFAVISFVAALLGALLSPSTWLHKALAVALCGVLSANPALIMRSLFILKRQVRLILSKWKLHNLVICWQIDHGSF